MNHAHHWVLDAAVGHPQVNAVCRHCGAERLFDVSHPSDQTDLKAKWAGSTIDFGKPDRRVHRRRHPYKGAM